MAKAVAPAQRPAVTVDDVLDIRFEVWALNLTLPILNQAADDALAAEAARCQEENRQPNLDLPEVVERLDHQCQLSEWLKTIAAIGERAGLSMEKCRRLSNALTDGKALDPLSLQEDALVELDRLAAVIENPAETGGDGKAGGKKRGRGRKRPGKWTDNELLFLDVLKTHHGVEPPPTEGSGESMSCTNTEPLTGRELARRAGKSTSHRLATLFFDKWLPGGGQEEYNRLCANPRALAFQILRATGDLPSFMPRVSDHQSDDSEAEPEGE